MGYVGQKEEQINEVCSFFVWGPVWKSHLLYLITLSV